MARGCGGTWKGAGGESSPPGRFDCGVMIRAPPSGKRREGGKVRSTPTILQFVMEKRCSKDSGNDRIRIEFIRTIKLSLSTNLTKDFNVTAQLFFTTLSSGEMQ